MKPQADDHDSCTDEPCLEWDASGDGGYDMLCHHQAVDEGRWSNMDEMNCSMDSAYQIRNVGEEVFIRNVIDQTQSLLFGDLGMDATGPQESCRYTVNQSRAAQTYNVNATSSDDNLSTTSTEYFSCFSDDSSDEEDIIKSLKKSLDGSEGICQNRKFEVALNSAVTQLYRQLYPFTEHPCTAPARALEPSRIAYCNGESQTLDNSAWMDICSTSIIKDSVLNDDVIEPPSAELIDTSELMNVLSTEFDAATVERNYSFTFLENIDDPLKNTSNWESQTPWLKIFRSSQNVLCDFGNGKEQSNSDIYDNAMATNNGERGLSNSGSDDSLLDIPSEEAFADMYEHDIFILQEKDMQYEISPIIASTIKTKSNETCLNVFHDVHENEKGDTLGNETYNKMLDPISNHLVPKSVHMPFKDGHDVILSSFDIHVPLSPCNESVPEEEHFCEFNSQWISSVDTKNTSGTNTEIFVNDHLPPTASEVMSVTEESASSAIQSRNYNIDLAIDSRNEERLNKNKSSFECCIDFFENLASKNCTQKDVDHTIEKKRSSFSCIIEEFEKKILETSSTLSTKQDSNESFFSCVDDDGSAYTSLLISTQRHPRGIVETEEEETYRLLYGCAQNILNVMESSGIQKISGFNNEVQGHSNELDCVSLDDEVSMLADNLVRDSIMVSERTLLMEYWRDFNKSVNQIANKRKTNEYGFEKFFDYDIDLNSQSQASITNKPDVSLQNYHAEAYCAKPLSAKPIKQKSLGRGRGKPYDVLSHSSNKENHLNTMYDHKGEKCRGYADRIIPKQLDKLANMLSKYAVIGAQRDVSTEYLDLEYAKLRHIRMSSRRNRYKQNRRHVEGGAFNKNTWSHGIMKDHSLDRATKHVSFSTSLPVNNRSVEHNNSRGERSRFVCQACEMSQNDKIKKYPNTRNSEFEFQQQTIKCSLCSKNH